MITWVEKGQFRFTTSRQEVLATPNLGACVAIGALDPDSELAGLVQYVLPETKNNPAPEGFPAFFGEEAIPLFFHTFKEKGGDPHRAKIVVVGGGRFRKSPKWLDIGLKNVAAARYYLKRLGLFPLAERVGEPSPRRIEVSLREGLKVFTFSKVESW